MNSRFNKNELENIKFLIHVWSDTLYRWGYRYSNQKKWIDTKASFFASRETWKISGKDGSDFTWPEHLEKTYKEKEREFKNLFRMESNLPQIGEKWVSETLVKNYVNKLLLEYKKQCFFHYRPRYLKGKELDIYFELDGKKIGIEYQGKQHFEPVKFFGGIEAFKSLKKRDLQKKIICKKENIILIYFTYRDALTFDEIKNRIQFQAGINFRN